MGETKHNSASRHGVYSLRQSYLFITALITLLVFTFALAAQSYVSSSTAQHRELIEQRNHASLQIRQLRNAVLQIEKSLDAFMWEPSPQQRQVVHHNIDEALQYYHELTLQGWLQHNGSSEKMEDFTLDLQGLHITLDRVMDNRIDRYNQFPDLAELERGILEVEPLFTAAIISLAQHTPRYEKALLQLRHDWGDLNDALKGYLANHASGLFAEQLPQQRLALEKQQQVIGEELEKLRVNTSLARDLPTSGEWQNLLSAWHLWQQGYGKNLQNADQNLLRNDIPYLKHSVEAHFEHLWDYVKKLDTTMEAVSDDDMRAFSSVAGTMAYVVWILAIFGLLVLAGGFLYFERRVLKPIAMVSRALKEGASSGYVTQLPRVNSLETGHLLRAYEEMRDQVQDRQQALEHIATHDSLTTLPNRYHLQQRLKALCEESRRDGAEFAVLMIGIDRFKEINDTLGQHTGDQVLKQFGARLRYLLRTSDSIARFGGDEFTLLLPNTPREEALHVARKILTEVEHPIELEGINLTLSCSIGISLYPTNGADGEELTRRANIAMTIAKQHKLGHTLYDKRYDTNNILHLSLAGSLRQAIQQGELQLSYQPQYRIDSGELSGMEVLCRWLHPQHGLIGPDEFIPIAEQTGLIHLLTEWVLNRTLQQAAEWRGEGLEPGTIAVNISAFNLHAPDFPRNLEQMLQKWRVPAEKVILEITESAMMSDHTYARAILEQLHRLGIRLAIDDFGTGFSSLAYLKQLPVDELKIDKSFVMDMTSNENDAVIVRSTIDLAHNLGLKVVAEGVDNKEKLDLLAILNCDYAQGYHLDKPLHANEMRQRLPLRRQGEKVHHLKDYR